jgi:hypothetical protein
MTVDWRAADRWLMGEAMTNTHIADYINALCDDIGPRWGGSEEERRAAEFIVATQTKNGLKDARTEEFQARSWASDAASVRVRGEESWKVDVRPCLFCPPVNASGPLVDAGFGMEHELDPVRDRLRGAIAILSASFEPFSPPRPHTVRLEDLAKLGVKAVISPHGEGGRRLSHGSAADWRDAAPDYAPLPWLQTSREDGARLRRRAAQGKRAAIKVAARVFDATSRNTVAELPGTRWPDEQIVLGAHHDTTPDSPGANDNGSGTSVVLETARLLAASQWEAGDGPGRTLQFVTFGSEEQTLQGSTAFVARHYASGVPRRGVLRPDLDRDQDGGRRARAGQGRAGGPEPRPRLMINLDELATGNMKGVALVFPELRPLVQRELDSMREGLRCHVMAQMDASGDMFPFARAGIPASMLWRWRFVGRHPDAGFGHASTDTPDKVRVRELKEYAGLLSRLLLRLSHVPPGDWPENRLDTRAIAKRIEQERGSVVRTM